MFTWSPSERGNAPGEASAFYAPSPGLRIGHDPDNVPATVSSSQSEGAPSARGLEESASFSTLLGVRKPTAVPASKGRASEVLAAGCAPVSTALQSAKLSAASPGDLHRQGGRVSGTKRTWKVPVAAEEQAGLPAQRCRPGEVGSTQDRQQLRQDGSTSSRKGRERSPGRSPVLLTEKTQIAGCKLR